jgi:glycosyltransferase involved in cell wall biosynthesis
MAAGVPVVGYAFGAQPELIEHGVDGWLVMPGDIDGLAAGVHWALEHREDIGAAAREKAKQFSWASAAKMYRAIYDEACEMHRHDGNPRTTVLVTAYRLDQYLPDALESVAAQTDQDWECIIVDDASPDRCGEIADEWERKDPRFRVIHNPTNLYLAEARNVGIDAARGRYVIPLDADDMLPPNAVQLLADSLDGDRTLTSAYGSVYFVDEDGQTPNDYGIPGKTRGHSGWPVPFEATKQVSGLNLQPYSSMFRKRSWELVGGYRRRLRTSEDADFWTRLASWGFRARQVTTEDTLIYRTRPESMSTSNRMKRMDYLNWFTWHNDPRPAPGAIGGPKAISLFSPRVAVVIPVGPGHERYVQDAVDSVAAQTMPGWECIVVNDSGTDLRSRLPTWVKIIDTNVRDTGAARNIGIAQATAPAFLCLDADDYLQPVALELLTAAHRRSGGDIIYPDFFEDPDVEGSWKSFELDDWECGHLTRRGAIHSVVALTPVDVWRKVGGYAEGINWEDWDFQFRCAAAGYCTRRLAMPLFNYRKWTGKRRDWKDGGEFEERKTEIVKRWGQYWEGELLMACSCKGGTIRARESNGGDSGSASKSLPGTPDAVLVEYVGNKAGRTSYRAVTGTVYTFTAGERPKWVKGADLETFARLADFRVVPTNGHVDESRDGSGVSPVLVA